jgi:hypothetical protein
VLGVALGAHGSHRGLERAPEPGISDAAVWKGGTRKKAAGSDGVGPRARDDVSEWAGWLATRLKVQRGPKQSGRLIRGHS